MARAMLTATGKLPTKGAGQLGIGIRVSLRFPCAFAVQGLDVR